MASKLTKERREQLRRDPKRAETPADHVYLINVDVDVLSKAQEKLVSLKHSDLDKWEKKQIYKENRGRLLSVTPHPLTELGTLIDSAVRMNGVDLHAMMNNLDYAKKVMLRFKSIDDVWVEFTDGSYTTTLVLNDGRKARGGSSWSATLSVWLAFIPVYLGFLEKKKEDWEAKRRAEKRVELGLERGPGLSDRALRYRKFLETRRERKVR